MFVYLTEETRGQLSADKAAADHEIIAPAFMLQRQSRYSISAAGAFGCTREGGRGVPSKQGHLRRVNMSVAPV